MERGFLFIVLDSRDELWQQSPPSATRVSSKNLVSYLLVRGEARWRQGQAGSSRSSPGFHEIIFSTRTPRPPPGLVIGQNSGLISIFNLGRQTIKTSRNKPNMSKVKRQVGPGPVWPRPAARRLRLVWWGCSVRGAWEASDRCYDQQPTSENLIDQAHTFGCRSRAQAELSAHV